ncbi:hypothetical protein [Miltoncostaea marina]|uniref:hypothetical protein n=1 Tax=Miltoncostaea marina TaxID=2843215 RepID=UPI001C3D7610|nr:hypothetical protein [Miltoncostaea marina]
MDRGRQGGQAAAEWIGLTAALALMLVALTAWMLPALRPPAAPPDLVGAVARPLAPTADSLREAARQAALERLALLRAPRGDRPIGRVLRRAVGDLRTGAIIALQARHEFSTGFNRRLVEQLRRIVEDPLGELAALPDPADLAPGALLRRAIARRDELRAYLARLRVMPARRAITTAAGDLGELSADATVEVLEVIARRSAGRIARGPRPSGGGGPAPGPGDAPRS